MLSCAQQRGLDRGLQRHLCRLETSPDCPQPAHYSARVVASAKESSSTRLGESIPVIIAIHPRTEIHCCTPSTRALVSLDPHQVGMPTIVASGPGHFTRVVMGSLEGEGVGRVAILPTLMVFPLPNRYCPTVIIILVAIAVAVAVCSCFVLFWCWCCLIRSCWFPPSNLIPFPKP